MSTGRHEPGLDNRRLEELLLGLGQAAAVKAMTSQESAPRLSAVLQAAQTRLPDKRRRTNMRRLATSFAVLLLATLGAAALVLWPRGNGWAVADGWIVEYKVDVPAYYGWDYGVNGAVDPTAPQDRLEKLVADWSAEHQDKAALPGQALASLHVGQAMDQADELLLSRANARLIFTSGDEGLRDELLDLLRHPGKGLPAMVGEPTIYSKTWYANEKYPERYEPRDIYIDGKAWKYPQDFQSEAELSNISGQVLLQAEQMGGLGTEPNGIPSVGKDGMTLQNIRNQPLTVYYNLLSDETLQKTGGGMVLVLSVDDKDQVHLDTLIRDDPFPELRPPECQWAAVGLSPADFTTDPEHVKKRLKFTLEYFSPSQEEKYEDIPSYRLVCLLYPRQDFDRSLDEDTYQPSWAEARQAIALREAGRKAVDDWLKDHPQYREVTHERKAGEQWEPTDPPRASVSVRDGNGSTRMPAESPGNTTEVMNYIVMPRVCLNVDVHGLSAAERSELRQTLEAVVGSGQVIEWRMQDFRIPITEDAKNSAGGPASEHSRPDKR